MLIHTRDMAASGPADKVEELSFSISREEADEEFAMEVMSAQLYSDKLKIIAQEYLSNARDAQREAGKANIPVSVHLPTPEEPWYEVSDSGNGISPELFAKIFMKYFASTKRGDDNTSKRQNGGFGLGAKSAWSYAPEFFVNTVNDGIEYRYHCYRNADKKRKAALLSKSRIGKGEHNGTTIRVNILPEDISLFVGKFRDITLMWGVKPKIVNVHSDFYTTFQANDIIYENNDVTVFERNRGARNSLTALVDDIPYPVDVRVLNDFLTEGERKFAANAAAYLHCDKLEVDPTPNRENLEYNNRTRDYIVSKVKSAYAAISDLTQSKVDAATSYWNACCIWYSDESIKTLCRIIDAPKYKGISLPTVTDNTIRYNNTYRRGKERTSVYQVLFTTVPDGVVRIREVRDISNHTFHPNFPIVFQVGGMPNKCNDKMWALYNTLVKDTVNHPSVTGFNLVRLPSEDDSYKEVISDLEKTYNWSKLLKYDLGEVVVPKVKAARSPRGGLKGSFYEITNSSEPKLEKVDVDFRGRYDIYIPINNKTVTIHGKNYRFDSQEVRLFKTLTGVDFSQAKLFAVPERFIKKLTKIRTMRSFDQAINDGINKLKAGVSFDDILNKWRSRDVYVTMLSGVNYQSRDLYGVIKDKVDPKSVFARVCTLNASGNPTTCLTPIENNIIWYLRQTGHDMDGKANETPQIEADRNLVKIFKEFYNPFFDIVSTHSIRNDSKKIGLLLNIIEMIEGKIAASV
jgi:hypothetical protein